MRFSLLLLLSACTVDPSGNKDRFPGADSGESDSTGLDSGTLSRDSATAPQDQDEDGFTTRDGDCDDEDATVHPGAEELCDGKDNDCDGLSTGEGDTDTDGLWDCEDFCPIQVDLNAAAGGDGSFARPFQVVQTGIDAAPALACYEVEVHPGTYTENLDFHGYPVDLRALEGPDLTVLDGGGLGSVVSFITGETSASRVYGFTITGGQADRGGGITVVSADPTIEGNVLTANSANLGGGLYLYDSQATALDNVFQGNEAGWGGTDDGNDGGGVAILFGAPLVVGNTFSENRAGDGGGLWAARSTATVRNNLFVSNSADDQGRTDDSGYTLYGQGGGAALQSGTLGLVFTNNILAYNTASSHGGGLGIIGFYQESDVAEPTVTYNTILWNTVGSDGYGAGVVVWGKGAAQLNNNIIVWNEGVGVYSQYSALDFRYNDVYGNGSGSVGALTGANNLAVDPGFVAASDDGELGNDDLQLGAGSGCVDVGDPSGVDADGSAADLGAYGGPEGAGW